MESSLNAFAKRKKAVRRKHTRMARGYRNKYDRKTGLIVQRPDSKAAGIAVRILILMVVSFMVFKSFVLAGLGEEVYLNNIAKLEIGSAPERLGAWLMQIDPVTVKLSEWAAVVLAAL